MAFRSAAARPAGTLPHLSHALPASTKTVTAPTDRRSPPQNTNSPSPQDASRPATTSTPDCRSAPAATLHAYTCCIGNPPQDRTDKLCRDTAPPATPHKSPTDPSSAACPSPGDSQTRSPPSAAPGPPAFPSPPWTPASRSGGNPWSAQSAAPAAGTAAPSPPSSPAASCAARNGTYPGINSLRHSAPSCPYPQSAPCPASPRQRTHPSA